MTRFELLLLCQLSLNHCPKRLPKFQRRSQRLCSSCHRPVAIPATASEDFQGNRTLLKIIPKLKSAKVVTFSYLMTECINWFVFLQCQCNFIIQQFNRHAACTFGSLQSRWNHYWSTKHISFHDWQTPVMDVTQLSKAQQKCSVLTIALSFICQFKLGPLNFVREKQIQLILFNVVKNKRFGQSFGHR